jgi:hypothetical protein
MVIKKKNLASIARSGKNISTFSTVTNNVTEKPKTKEEERDIKAKETVEKLLEGVELVPKKENDTVEIETTVHKEGKEWLEEQVGLLSEQVEQLRSELGQSKEDYTKIYQELQLKKGNPKDLLNETLVQNVVLMFNELQANLTGRNQERTPHDIVKIDYLLNQIMLLFPFTEQYRKF